MTRIMIVDEDPFFAQALAATLEMAGYEVSVAHDAAEGVRRGIAERPDVLITAWVFKGGASGRDVCRQIRAIRPSARTIVMTAYPDRAVEAARTCACIEDVLLKPFHQSEILETVRRAMNDARGCVRTPAMLSSSLEGDNHCELLTQGSKK